MRKRWKATINYRSNDGPIDVVHHLHELEELHDLVERGPHWDTIIDINIVRIFPIEHDLTLERAEVLRENTKKL